MSKYNFNAVFASGKSALVEFDRVVIEDDGRYTFALDLGPHGESVSQVTQKSTMSGTDGLRAYVAEHVDPADVSQAPA